MLKIANTLCQMCRIEKIDIPQAKKIIHQNPPQPQNLEQKINTTEVKVHKNHKLDSYSHIYSTV